MPVCARVGCPVILGMTDEHKFCFGHRDCSLTYPCEICEHWTLATSRLLLSDYNARRGSMPTRVFHPTPAATVTSANPVTVPPPAPRSQDDWGSLSSAASCSPEPHTHQSHAPLSRSDWSVSSRGVRRDYLPGKELTPPAPLSQSRPSVPLSPPALRGLPSPSRRRRHRRRRPSWTPEVPSAQPPTVPSQQPPSRPARATFVHPGPTFLPPDIHDDYFVEGSNLPWAKPLEVVSLSKSGAILEPCYDDDVLVVSTDERLDSSTAPVLHPLQSKSCKSPFPDVSWSEVETRAVHLVASILPKEVISMPSSTNLQYPSARDEPKHHSFKLPPVVLDEFDAIASHLVAPSSGNPNVSLTKPYPLTLHKWVPAQVFPLLYPAMDNDLDLLVKDPPTTLTTKVDTHTHRERFYRAIVHSLTESALAQEASFLATEGLLTTTSRPHLRIAENVRTAMALSKNRTDTALKLAIRGLSSGMLLHRDAILAESRTSSIRRRQIRSARLEGQFLFNQELAQLRNVLTPVSSVPAASAPSAPARSSTRTSSWNPSFQERDSSRGRRHRSRQNPSSRSFSGGRRGKPAASATKPNSHKRPDRK